MAATLAKYGMSGSADLESWLGAVLSGQQWDLGAIVRGLGSAPWRVHEIWIKKYPCCFLTHRHIDMMREVLSERGIREPDVARIEIEVGPVDATCNRPKPKDPEDARFSFHHIMAALMLDGDIDTPYFSPEKLSDPRFQNAWGKVVVNVQPNWPPEFMSGVARLSVLLKNGEKVVKERAQALGGPLEPLSGDQFKALYEKYTRGALKPEEVEWTWQVLSELEKVEDLGKWIRKLTFSQ
jgi:2-methylcitrate dehydratase PrpD